MTATRSSTWTTTQPEGAETWPESEIASSRSSRSLPSGSSAVMVATPRDVIAGCPDASRFQRRSTEPVRGREGPLGR